MLSVVAFDWEQDGEAVHVPGPPRADQTWGPGVTSDDPLSVPAVRALRDQGYEPAPEAPLWCFLPAVWPRTDRAWVEDTRVRYAMVSCDGEPSRRRPWTTSDYLEVEAETNALLQECGIGPRPGGRIWLLRPPPGMASLADVLAAVVRSARAADPDLPACAGAALAEHTARELVVLFDA